MSSSPTKRPLSPHLQVYRLPLTAKMSISHRITGVALSVGTLLLVWQLVAAASGPARYAQFSAIVGSPIGLIALAGWSYCLFYHLCNGIRHLAWDAGKGLELPEASRSNNIVIVLSVVLFLATWIGAYLIRGSL